MNVLTTKAGGSPGTAAATAAVMVIASLAALRVTISRLSRSDHVTRKSGTCKSYIASPLRTQIPDLTPTQIAELPYPPEGALPGGRDVETAYGSIRVYEWGPETGEKVLFVHGISTPCIALGDLGWELVRKGYRVMLFDLFGRGYSDAPLDIPYDTRLYTTQILLVLASSHLSWLSSPPAFGQTSTSTSAIPSVEADPPGFHLLGYSLGGCLCVSFAIQFPHLLRSLDLIASSGLIRRRHVGGASRFLYESGLLPEWFIHDLVRRRIRPVDPPPQLAADAALKEPTNDDEESSGADMLVAEASVPPPASPLPHTIDDQATLEAQYQTREPPAGLSARPLTQPSAGAGSRGNGNSDATGGAAFDSASLSRDRPDVTVSSVVRWQVDEHAGFIGAFMSTIRECPIYAQPQGDTDWAALRDILLLPGAEDRNAGHVSTPANDDTDAGPIAGGVNNTCDFRDRSGTKGRADRGPERGLSAKGKILVVLGGKDTVIDRDETMQDITAIFNKGDRPGARRQLVDFVVFEDAGHEVPITSSAEVAGALVRHWQEGSTVEKEP